MPVPYRDAQDIDELGAAAYLRMEREPSDAGFRGALLVINARGHPLQFTYTRASTQRSPLWRRGDIARYAARRVAETLFAVCPQAPRILVCLADDIPREVFDEDLAVAVPVCRVRPDFPLSGGDDPANMHSTRPELITWLPTTPAVTSVEMRLFAELSRRGLVLDAFHRASAGLKEVFPDGMPV